MRILIRGGGRRIKQFQVKIVLLKHALTQAHINGESYDNHHLDIKANIPFKFYFSLLIRRVYLEILVKYPKEKSKYVSLLLHVLSRKASVNYVNQGKRKL